MHIHGGKLESSSVSSGMEQAEPCITIHGHGRTDRHKEAVAVAAAAVNGILSGPKPPRI